MAHANTDEERQDEETYAIIGAAMTVHRELGHGFLEAVYGDAFQTELEERNIPFKSEVRLPILYRGQPLQTTYRADFACFGAVLTEVKALRAITAVEEARVINYLKASGLAKAVLLNLGTPSLQYKRLVFNLRQSA